MSEPKRCQGELSAYSLADASPFAHGRASACFRARDTSGNMICLKEFTQAPVNAPGSQGSQAFLRELAARRKLTHPNILPILDHGTDGDLPFIVMPLCDHDLRKVMRGRAFVPFSEAMLVLRHVASAIDYAHEQGVIHGDVKPENILFQTDGNRVFLSDFGTSRFFTYSEMMFTASDLVRGGTTAYLSPEQLQHNKQTVLSDIYSFATVAFETLTGEMPVDRRLPQLQQMLDKVNGNLRNAHAFNARLNEHVSSALASGLHMNPEERPRSARQLCEALESAMYSRSSALNTAGGVVTAPPERPAAHASAPTEEKTGRTLYDVLAQLLATRSLARWLPILVVVFLIAVFGIAHVQAEPGKAVEVFGISWWKKAPASQAPPEAQTPPALDAPASP